MRSLWGKGPLQAGARQHEKGRIPCVPPHGLFKSGVGGISVVRKKQGQIDRHAGDCGVSKVEIVDSVSASVCPGEVGRARERPRRGDGCQTGTSVRHTWQPNRLSREVGLGCRRDLLDPRSQLTCTRAVSCPHHLLSVTENLETIGNVAEKT